MDRITKEQRSVIMSRIRARDTGPEMLVRKRLFALGWRYRICDRRYRGKPDIVIPKARTVIDVRGCFWHRHGCSDSTMPKTNVKFWMEKWSKNVKRDHANEKTWREEGWNVIVVWQCALEKKRLERSLGKIAQCVAKWSNEPEGKRPHRIEIG